MQHETPCRVIKESLTRLLPTSSSFPSRIPFSFISLHSFTFYPVTMRISKRGWTIISSALLLVLGYHFRASLAEEAINIFDELPVSPRYKAEKYDFVSTEFEGACFAGQNSTDKEPIPNIVHFVVGLHDPEISYPAYLSIQSALQSLEPDILKLHHTGNLNFENEFVRSLLRETNVLPVQHNPEQLALQMSGSSHYAHLADILRLEVLLEDGGIYLDSDVFALKSFAALRTSQLDVVLGNEGGNRNGLCNAIILARPGAAFIQRWLNSYEDFHDGEWNVHSVLLPKVWAELHPGEVCQLSPHAFFWPTWTRRHVQWMHEPLNAQEVAETQRRLELNGGSLYDGQLAYHAWNQMSWSQYLSGLNDQSVSERDTRFNLMIRRFIE
jgi:Glycosyltransferase sugar-binding region containing DXD motif